MTFSSLPYPSRLGHLIGFLGEQLHFEKVRDENWPEEITYGNNPRRVIPYSWRGEGLSCGCRRMRWRLP
jgi:hypothetical protein